MKRLFLLLIFLNLSCEEVVEVDVPNSEPRLVIEANLDWEKGTSGNNQEIKLSISTPYFSETPNVPATGAIVKVTNLNTSTEFVFTDNDNGTYSIDSFIPQLNNTYELEINYLGNIYKGKETLYPVPNIHTITQSMENGFDDESLEVNIFFDDPIDETNYYLTKFKTVYDIFPYYFPLEDEFTNGNTMTMFYEEENNELETGDNVYIYLYSISEQYYNYMNLLLNQVESDGPFNTTPVTLVGNCINVSEPDLKPFGYFRVTEMVNTEYTVE